MTLVTAFLLVLRPPALDERESGFGLTSNGLACVVDENGTPGRRGGGLDVDGIDEVWSDLIRFEQIWASPVRLKSK